MATCDASSYNAGNGRKACVVSNCLLLEIVACIVLTSVYKPLDVRVASRQLRVFVLQAVPPFEEVALDYLSNNGVRFFDW